MLTTPFAWTQASDLIHFAVTDSKYSFNCSVRVLAQRRKKVRLIIKVQLSKDIFESNLCCGRRAPRNMDVILVESRIRVVGTSQQCPERIDNCRLANVVGSDKNVEAGYKFKSRVAQTTKILDRQFG